MTHGTVLSFDPARGTGTLTIAANTRIPFSSRRSSFAEGDLVSFRVVGGIAGVYALDVARVEPAAAPHRQTATSLSAFRWSAGTWAPSAG